jgi:hypothetical protein
MDIRQSIFGEIAQYSGPVINVYGIEQGTLLRRLLLFDSVVIRSIRLREVPFLIRAFRKEGFLRLLNADILKLSCEFTSLIVDFARNGIRSVPLSHFTFGIVDTAEREKVLRSELHRLQGVPGLNNADRALMEETILSKLVRPPADYGAQLQAQVESDLRQNAPVLREAVAEQLRRQGADQSRPFNIHVEETQERVFHIASDLSRIYGTTEQKVHEILSPAVSAVGNLNQRIANMQAYSAITGFTEAEAPLLFGKFAGIFVQQNPAPIEERFARVLEVTALPDFITGKRVDVEKLMVIRESAECREFRHWLTTLDQVSDKEIEEMFGGLRSKLTSMIQSGTGKALRLATTTAVGLIPTAGLVAGPVAGVLDSFLVDRVFQTSGVVAFLTKTYPSLFVSA